MKTFDFVFVQPQIDQVTLIPPNGLLISANQSAVTFNQSTDFIDNVSNTELALSGFSLENQMNMEYTASINYTRGLFTFTVQTFNQTIFQYISFYAILYTTKANNYFQSRSLCLQCQILSKNPNRNRTQQMNFTMNTNRTSGNNFYVRPFIRSMKTREGDNGYTRLQVSFSFWEMFSTRLVAMLSTYQSIVEEACITVVALAHAVVGANYAFLVSDLTVRQFFAASIKSAPPNLGISSTIYGPIFNKKCLIGFQNLYFRDGIKQIYFDATGVGIQSLTQNTPQYFYAELSIFCVTRQKTCQLNQGIQTGVQQCVNCSLMIKNCAFCRSESECRTCSTGHFIDKNKKCCPTYLTNCSVCSSSNTCSQCAEGYYISQGLCALCSTAIANCIRCTNNTFCFKCKQGYTADNFTACKIQSASSTNNSSNTTPNDNSNNNNSTDADSNSNDSNSKPTGDPSGLSLWMILFIAFAGAFALIFLVLIFVCIKFKKNSQNNNNPASPNQNHDEKDKQNQQDIRDLSNNDPFQTRPAPTSMENHKLTTDINSYAPSQDMIDESQLKPGSGMGIRYGSKFQSNLTNFIKPNHKNITNNQSIPTKDQNSINSGKQKSTNHKDPDSLISSGMQRSNEGQLAYNEVKSGPQTERGFLKKDISFLPQNSKNQVRFGGSIRLKANYYK